MEDYSFETFHLVDELLLQADLTQTAQSVLEAESALWTLEQLLCLVPELVGSGIRAYLKLFYIIFKWFFSKFSFLALKIYSKPKVYSGWQKHAIEYVLKKALFPHNLLAVRKIALRLFIIWYQSLAMYSNNTPQLDIVFQCLLPHFPLRFANLCINFIRFSNFLESLFVKLLNFVYFSLFGKRFSSFLIRWKIGYLIYFCQIILIHLFLGIICLRKTFCIIIVSRLLVLLDQALSATHRLYAIRTMLRRV